MRSHGHSGSSTVTAPSSTATVTGCDGTSPVDASVTFMASVEVPAAAASNVTTNNSPSPLIVSGYVAKLMFSSPSLISYALVKLDKPSVIVPFATFVAVRMLAS